MIQVVNGIVFALVAFMAAPLTMALRPVDLRERCEWVHVERAPILQLGCYGACPPIGVDIQIEIPRCERTATIASDGWITTDVDITYLARFPWPP